MPASEPGAAERARVRRRAWPFGPDAAHRHGDVRRLVRRLSHRRRRLPRRAHHHAALPFGARSRPGAPGADSSHPPASRSMTADSLPDAGQVARFYDASSLAYRDLWAPLLAPPAQRLIDRLPLANARVVADIGSGVGTLLPALSTAAPDALPVGLDRALGMLSLAPRGSHVACADGMALPLAGGCVDVAVMAFMLFHAPDPVLALREVRRVLRPRA